MAETRPWVCDRCELIGSAAEANRHADDTGHDIRALNDAELAFWEEHTARLRAERAAAFMAFARLHTMAFNPSSSVLGVEGGNEE